MSNLHKPNTILHKPISILLTSSNQLAVTGGHVTENVIELSQRCLEAAAVLLLSRESQRLRFEVTQKPRITEFLPGFRHGKLSRRKPVRGRKK